MVVVNAIPAATVLLVRDTDGGVEVLMMRRNLNSGFVPGAYVFPGGALDDADRTPEMQALCSGMSDAQASGALGLAQDGLAYWAAAIRESFEEAGMLMAYDAAGQLIALDDTDRTERFRKHRDALNQGTRSLLEILRGERLTLATDQLVYFSHWITPERAPRRYDTRFFVAAAPSAQAPLHDNHETIAHLWVRPSDALARHKQKDFTLRFPTLRTLEDLAGYASVDALMQAMRAKRDIPAILVRLSKEGGRLLPGDPGYDDMVTRELQGVWENVIVAGEVVELTPLVRRVTAPNPGMMTGAGTNAYIVGSDKLALIDPGPVSDAHLKVMVSAVGERLRWILCTHTHTDHSPGARALKAATGAEVIGMRAPTAGKQDVAFAPDRVFSHGDVLDCGAFKLRAVHTPGHASNHLCYLLDSERLLFTGDHVMQGSTVVINPPDGNMVAYFKSLQALLELDISRIAPGHGHLIEDPHTEARRLIAHRLKREQKILEAFSAVNPATMDELVAIVYSDTPQRLHQVAQRSLLAHLIKLESEGRVSKQSERWNRSV